MPQGNPIYLRRGTAATWLSVNPTLDEGEQGLETDTGLVKIGNGTSAWDVLPYSKVSSHAASHGSAGSDPITVAQSQVTGLSTALAGKADATHTHATSDVTGLQTYVDGRISLVVDGAPAALDTLKELATALNNDASFASTVTTALAGKAATSHTHTLSQITDYVPPVVTLSNTFMLMGA